MKFSTVIVLLALFETESSALRGQDERNLKKKGKKKDDKNGGRDDSDDVGGMNNNNFASGTLYNNGGAAARPQNTAYANVGPQFGSGGVQTGTGTGAVAGSNTNYAGGNTNTNNAAVKPSNVGSSGGKEKKKKGKKKDKKSGSGSTSVGGNAIQNNFSTGQFRPTMGAWTPGTGQTGGAGTPVIGTTSFNPGLGGGAPIAGAPKTGVVSTNVNIVNTRPVNTNSMTPQNNNNGMPQNTPTQTNTNTATPAIDNMAGGTVTGTPSDGMGQHSQGQGQTNMNSQGQGQTNMNSQGQGQTNTNSQGQGQTNMNSQGQGQTNMNSQGQGQTNMNSPQITTPTVNTQPAIATTSPQQGMGMGMQASQSQPAPAPAPANYPSNWLIAPEGCVKANMPDWLWKDKSGSGMFNIEQMYARVPQCNYDDHCETGCCVRFHSGFKICQNPETMSEQMLKWCSGPCNMSVERSYEVNNDEGNPGI